jgi:hypothetical protein
MAAKDASVSDVQQVLSYTLGHALVSGSVPKGYAAQLANLLDEAPVRGVPMAVEEAAANEGFAPQGCVAQRCEASQVTGRAPAGPLCVMKPLPSGRWEVLSQRALRLVEDIHSQEGRSVAGPSEAEPP